MVDVFTKEKRSEIMKKVGPKNSKPELLVRSLIHCLGYRFRLHRRDLPGTPDLVFPRYRKIIFVHGCFWHGHIGCKKSKLPETNREFWENKINRNKENDKNSILKLNERGWEILTIWECQIKKSKIENLKKRITKFLTT